MLNGAQIDRAALIHGLGQTVIGVLELPLLNTIF
jgi:hypothetical protein